MSGTTPRATSSSGGAGRKRQAGGAGGKNGRFLSKDEIVSITGAEDLGSLKELEVLFVHLEDIDGGAEAGESALGLCRNLTRLALIDNGLRRLSPGLQLLGRSLTSLCICDQEVDTIAYLDLPVLRELYLHRNRVADMSGLAACPRLKKLWLSQNRISRISGLEDLPELEELMLHGNELVSLRGIEACRGSLQILGLAGNHIADYEEMYRLNALTKLRSLALQDVHFGLNPISLDPSYKSFCLVYMSATLEWLDGVVVTREGRVLAKDTMKAQMNSYADVARLVEENVRQEIAGIAGRQQAALSHVSVLEREMVEALRELEALVAEGRASITKQVRRQKRVVESSRKALEARINEGLSEALSKLGVSEGAKASSAGAIAVSSDDVIEASFCVLERSLSAEAEVVQVLAYCSAATSKGILVPTVPIAAVAPNVSPRASKKAKASLPSPTSPRYEDDFVEESVPGDDSAFITATASISISGGGNSSSNATMSGAITPARKGKGGRETDSKVVFVYQPLVETSPDYLRLSSLFADYNSTAATPVLLKAFRTGVFQHHSMSTGASMELNKSSNATGPTGISSSGGRSSTSTSSIDGLQYCYAVIAASENQLQRVLLPGGLAGPSAPTGSSILLFTDMRLALSLHSSGINGSSSGGEGGAASYSCFAQDAAIRRSLMRNEDTVDNNTNNSNGNSSKGGSASKNSNSSFRAALDASIFCVACCRLDVGLFKELMAHSSGASVQPSDLKLPSSATARTDLLRSLREAQRPAMYSIDIASSSGSGAALTAKGGAGASSNSSNSSLYVLPLSALAAPSSLSGSAPGTGGLSMLLRTDFVCTCMSATIEGVLAPEGGLRALEHKLELILTPPMDPSNMTSNAGGKSGSGSGGGAGISNTSAAADDDGGRSPSKRAGTAATSERNELFANGVLIDFNSLVARELRAYVDRIAEDMESAAAEAELVAGNEEAEGRADAIRALKRQIVEERRAQEAILKRIKDPNSNGSGATNNNSGGGGNAQSGTGRSRPMPLSARR